MVALAIIAFFAVLGIIGAILGPPPETNTALTTATSLPATSTVASRSSNVSYQSFQDTEFGFSVQIPATWSIFRDPSPSSQMSAAGITSALSVHPASGQGFGGSFVVSVDKTPMANSSAHYLPIYKEKLAQIWSSQGITFSSNSNATLAGNAGFVITYVIHFPSDVGGDCPSRDLVAMHNGAAYIVSLDDCKAQEAAAYLGTFDNFVAAFTFLNQ